MSRGSQLGKIALPWRFLGRTELGLLLANVVVYSAVVVLDKQHNFLSPLSLQLLLFEASMLGIFAIGSAVVIISGGIDLSVGSVIAFSSVVCASVMKLLSPEAEAVGTGVIAVAVGASLAAGLVIGMVHAVLITRLGLPPFVATLGTLIGLRGAGRLLAQQLFDSDKVPAPSPSFRSLYNSTFNLDLSSMGFGLSVRWVPLLVFLAVALGVGFLMRRTVVGRHLYALGGNEEAARLSGIRTDRLKMLAYCLGALLASLAGILYAAREGQGNSQTMAVGYELSAIAAAVVGGCSLRGGLGTIRGTVLGVVFLTLVVNGIAMVIKIDSSLYEGIIVGVVVILAVALNRWRPES